MGLLRATMLLQSLTLAALASTSLALSLPQAVHLIDTSPAISLIATASPPVPQWACDVRAWVRAPDLAPNLLSTADARLIVNGSDCVDLVLWEVGLRFKERSIVRVPAKGVELPARPERNYTAMHGRTSGRRGGQGIFETGRRGGMGLPDVSSPYFAEVERYEAAMKNHSLWQVEGRERIVFDSKVELASAIGNDSFPLAVVRSFAVAVPNISLPPNPKSTNSWSSGPETPEYASIETQMSYYFALTLRNGTTLEVPAGYTIFSIAESDSYPAPPASGHLSVLVKPPSSARWGRKSACTLDNTTRFEVQIDMPMTGSSFAPGSQVFLNTTISRIGNSSVIPTYISLRPGTNIEQTWAAAFGRSFQQQSNLRREEGSFVWDGVRATRMQTTNTVKTRAEEEVEADAVDSDFHVFVPGDRDQAIGGTELQNTDIQSVLVNLTIPADIMPSYIATFKSYVSYLKVEVKTVQDCPEDTTVNLNAVGEDDDLRNDDLWSTATLAERSRRGGRNSRHRNREIFQHGNVTIHISAPPNLSSTPPTHYLTPDSPAPMLLAALPADGTSPTFLKMMGEELRKEGTSSELRQKRYDAWSIMPAHRWGDHADGGFQHAGQLWARKMRREQDAVEARVALVGFQYQE